MLRERREGGMVLPVVALGMALLLIMVAFAVDLGSASVARRNAQNAADAAALAAAQELGLTRAKFVSGSERIDALAAAAAAAKDYVQENTALPSNSPDWASCSDSFRLAVASATTQCISFSADATQVRVKLPTKVLAYQFGRVAGVDQTSIEGAAVAAVTSSFGGSTRPLLLRNSNFGMICVEGGGGDPCPSNTTVLGAGDFGSMVSPRYNLVVSGGDQTNMALGMDHMFRVTPTNGIDYCDSKNSGDENKCNNQAPGGLLNNAPGLYDLADYVFSDQGGQLKDMTQGLIGSSPQRPASCPVGQECFNDGGATITALLYRSDGSVSTQLITSGSPATPTLEGWSGRSRFNGVHVSRYLLPAMKTLICPVAPDSTSVALDDSGYEICNAELNTYIVANVASGVPIFSSAILQSPRFGVAPVTSTDLTGASTVAKLVEFYGIYLDGIYGTSEQQVKAIRAFVFPLSMIQPVSGAGSSQLPYFGGPFGVRLIQ